MSKSSKFLTTVVLGAAGGAAAAVFLASKTGKVIREKVEDFLKDYQNNPEAKHSEWTEKATDLKNQAVEKYSDVKHKFETGELRTEDIVDTVKEKAVEFKTRVTQDEFFAHLKEQAVDLAGKFKQEADVVKEEVEDVLAVEPVETVNAEVVSEEITIDLTEEETLATEIEDTQN